MNQHSTLPAATGIRPGTKLTVTMMDLPMNVPDSTFTSHYVEELDNNHFMMTAPMTKQGLVPLAIGSVLSISHLKGGMRYDFLGAVRDRYKREDAYYLVMERTSDILRTQRREDYRLDLTIDVTLSWKGLDSFQVYDETETHGITHDVGGGGAAVCVNANLREYERVVVQLLIPEAPERLVYNAETRWVTRRSGDIQYKYLCGMKFLFEHRADKQNLVQQLFYIQQQRMRADSLTNPDPAHAPERV